MARLQLDHLVKQYGRVGEPAVRDLSLDVDDGEFVCLLGPSGCGKTTTLRMIGGFLKPDAGDVRIDGVSVVNEPPERRPTAMVFQRYALWPHMTVWDNVAFGLRVRRGRKPRSRARRNRADLVGMPGFGRRYPQQLSGGSSSALRCPRARARTTHPVARRAAVEPHAQLRIHCAASSRRSSAASGSPPCS
jgi:putative spermidine/putrescine transport system ATP-binding protein